MVKKRADYCKYAELRDAKGVSDYKVAKDTGVAASSISDWKNGETEPKIEKLAAFAEYFCVPIESFLSEKEEI